MRRKPHSPARCFVSCCFAPFCRCPLRSGGFRNKTTPFINSNPPPAETGHRQASIRVESVPDPCVSLHCNACTSLGSKVESDPSKQSAKLVVGSNRQPWQCVTHEYVLGIRAIRSIDRKSEKVFKNRGNERTIVSGPTTYNNFAAHHSYYYMCPYLVKINESLDE